MTSRQRLQATLHHGAPDHVCVDFGSTAIPGMHASAASRLRRRSCGCILPLIPEFIDAGFDILNPVQTSAEGMGPGELKKEFGRHLVFWGGGVDTQHTMARGTPQQVYRISSVPRSEGCLWPE